MDCFVIYSRKSTEDEDRQVLSLETQEEEMQRLGRDRGVHVAESLGEAQSAKAPGRRVFNAMMERVYRGEIRGILVWKLDRLARNPIDGGAIIWAIVQHGLTIITPTQTFSSTSDNTILMHIEFGMAQKYIEDLSKNVKRGLYAKAARGCHPTLAPLGYLNNRHKEQGTRDIAKDSERFDLVRRMWDLMLTGRYSVPEIQQLANGSWGLRTRAGKVRRSEPLGRSHVYRIFANPFYYGWYEYPRGSGRWYQGSHPPMVTPEEFDRVQVLLGRKGRPRPNKRRFAFTGLIHCGECGRMITAEEKHQLICSHCRLKFAATNRDACPRCAKAIDAMDAPTRLHYVYYHCTGRTCRHGSISGAKLEGQIADELRRVDLSEEHTRWAFDAIHEEEARERGIGRIARVSVERAKAEIERRLDRLLDLKLSAANTDGALLSEEEFGRRRKQLVIEKLQLEERLAKRDSLYQRDFEKVRATFQLASGIRERFTKGSPATQKRILADVGSNLTITQKIFSMQAKIPFEMIATFSANDRVDSGEIEPEKSGSIPTRNAAYSSPCLIGCRESNEDRITKAAQGYVHQPQKRPRPKKVTRTSVRRLVKQLLKFFREDPGYEVPLPMKEIGGLREAA